MPTIRSLMTRPLLHHDLPDAPRRRAVVWLKRDLRRRDHAPLALGSTCTQATVLWILEPAWLSDPTFDAIHLQAALQAIDDLRQQGLPVIWRMGEACEVLSQLHDELAFDTLLSHEETGPHWTYQRDLAVAHWCRNRSVHWLEVPQSGVFRKQKDRRGWASRWEQRMNEPVWPAPPVDSQAFRPPPGIIPQPLPTWADLHLPEPDRHVQAVGEGAARSNLHSFLHERCGNYRRGLSKPAQATTSCSRISPHLAFGCLSMRQVHQATLAAVSHHQQAGRPAMALALQAFASRLRWQGHFMQKLEDEPAIEWRHFSQQVTGIRPGDTQPWGPPEEKRFQAWCEGRTGYPMVDACMRSLRATGWLNFRMRAMLVSFAAYHLWLHWREPGLFLARQFLDFEPGIHWSQMQMQSGTTGINTLRIYSPAKQAREQDPEGHFIRQWIPEWGTDAYPAPIVDEAPALHHAKNVLYGLRQSEAAQAEAQQIQLKHGSRRAGLPHSGRATKRRVSASTPRSTAQAELFT